MRERERKNERERRIEGEMPRHRLAESIHVP